MEIVKNQNGSKLEVSISGRLDTTTAPELEKELQNLEGVGELVLDFSALEYISSAGLRILLATQKTMNKQGKMKITHANDSIMEVFEITGFIDILDVE